MQSPCAATPLCPVGQSTAGLRSIIAFLAAHRAFCCYCRSEAHPERPRKAQGFILGTMSRQVQVKNRAPAPIQITAEQILREANDRIEKEVKAPRTHITDPEELMQVCEQACGLVSALWGHPHECCVLPSSSVYTSGRSMRTRSAVSDNILGTTSSMQRGRRVRMSSKEPVPFSSGKPHPPRQAFIVHCFAVFRAVSSCTIVVMV